MASGNEELLAMAQAGQKKFLASAGNFVNSGIGKFFAGSGQGALNARYADALKGSGLDLNKVDDWSEEDKDKYAKLTKKKRPTVKETPAVTPAVTAAVTAAGVSSSQRRRNNETGITSSGSDRDKGRGTTAATAAKIKASVAASTNKDGTKTAIVGRRDSSGKTIGQAGYKSKQRENKEKKDTQKIKDKAKRIKAGGAGGFNEGGLMKRNQIK